MRSVLRGVIQWLKRLRAVPAINAPLTYGVRAALRLSGRECEFAIKHLPHVGKTTTRLPNGGHAMFWSRGDDWISNQIFWRGWDGYEPEVAQIFWSLAARAEVIFDVGAHIGYYTVLAALVNPGGTVYSLEPLPRVFERLIRNVRLNELQNVVAVQRAAGAVDGEADFFHVHGIIPCSSSLSSSFMRGTPDIESLRVRVTRIDTLVEENDLHRVDLVKLDTETTEPEVLAGMTNLLHQWKPDIICEVLREADSKALAETLQPLGYTFYHLTGRGPESRAQPLWHPRWLNYLFTAKNYEHAQSAP